LLNNYFTNKEVEIMEKAIINQDVKLLIAWEFLKIRKGTEVNFVQNLPFDRSHIQLKKGKHEGKSIYIDSNLVEKVVN
jgi:hypothetical protein